MTPYSTSKLLEEQCTFGICKKGLESLVEMEACPQCNNSSNFPASRLVQDSCGHKKCRICLLQDESECKMCIQNKEAKEISVAKYENNHTAVITCNKFKITSDSENLNKTLTNNIQEDENNDGAKSNDKRSYNFISLPNYISVLTENPLVYKCNVCGKSFKTKSHIKYHSYCGGDQKPLRCEMCDKEFISKYHLEMHLLGHSGKKLYTCDICNKSFKQFGILTRHKVIHSDLNQFACLQCEKSFKSKDYLQRHMIIHNTEKPFNCKLCSAKFNNRSNLNQHQATHTKEKIHMCDECGKRFKLKGALTVHRRSHTRLRPHKCSTCFKTFINAKELQRHNLIHSDTKAYVCSLCSVSFRRKDNLQRHVRNTHPGKKSKLLKKPSKRARLKNAQAETPAENPNAINVITASPINKEHILKLEPVLSKPVPVINAPLKLAFKTTAFKSHYNIHSREYVEPGRVQPKPYDYEESVSICQKILSPSSPPVSRSIIKSEIVSEQQSNEMYQRGLSPPVIPVNNDDGFESYSVRNIKFKLPSKYINLSKQNIFNDINTSTHPQDVNGDKVYTEMKPMPPTNAASVIVNSQSFSQNEVHWRRRTLQNLELQSKSIDF